MRLLKTLIITATLVVLATVSTEAKDKIPRDDFIKYTEACLDVLDEMEVEYPKYNMSPRAIKELDVKYTLCMKKIFRYGAYKDWDESMQKEITKHLSRVNIENIFITQQLDLIAISSELIHKEYVSKSVIEDSKKTIIDSKADITQRVDNIMESIKKTKSLFLLYKEAQETTPPKKSKSPKTK
jgi:hypothetical protein